MALARVQATRGPLPPAGGSPAASRRRRLATAEPTAIAEPRPLPGGQRRSEELARLETITIDADTVVCRHDPGRGPFSTLVAAVVAAGIDVERADFTTPWTTQLVEQSGR